TYGGPVGLRPRNKGRTRIRRGREGGAARRKKEAQADIPLEHAGPPGGPQVDAGGGGPCREGGRKSVGRSTSHVSPNQLISLRAWGEDRSGAARTSRMKRASKKQEPNGIGELCAA